MEIALRMVLMVWQLLHFVKCIKRNQIDETIAQKMDDIAWCCIEVFPIGVHIIVNESYDWIAHDVEIK